MAQSNENIWTLRFQTILGLTVAGQIILGIVIYRIFEYSYARAELALTALLLLCGIAILSYLQGPVARRIMLGAGCFILLALLFLLTAPNAPGATGIAGQRNNTLQPFIANAALVLTLLALLGKIAADRAAHVADMTYEQNNWFADLEHIALAAIAGVELFFQLSSGNQIQLLPFNSTLYAGLSLSTITALLLGAVVIFSLISLRSPLTWLDGLMVLILGAIAALFQYTFGAAELARFAPTMSQALITNINLGLSILPLVLGVFAVLAERMRFITPLWLAFQLLILQPFVATSRVRTGVGAGTRLGTGVGAGTRLGTGTGARVGGIFPTTALGQTVLYVLAIALILLALRLLLYWDRRRLNAIDGITIAIIALAVGITAWSLGQTGLFIIAYVIGMCTILALVLIGLYTFFSHSNPWLERVENIVSILMVLSITVGALLLLNIANGPGSFIAATTLNPHNLSPTLPQILVRNQYVLDVLFVVLLLIYAFALVKQHWNRLFGHTERALILLSGITCLLLLASGGKSAILPLVTANIQHFTVYSRAVFTAENIAAACILIAALISLLWLFRGRNIVDRIVLTTLFGVAALCTLIYYLGAFSLLLLVALLLLTAGTLIASRIEQVQTNPQTPAITQNSNGTTVHSAP